mgnify:CR=1 FL=1
MHATNLAMVKIAEAAAKGFTSVRFAPLCYAGTIRVFQGLGSDRVIRKLNRELYKKQSGHLIGRDRH